MSQKQNKILVAIDHSRQATDAAAYISSVISPDKHTVMLFHIEHAHFDIFLDINGELPSEAFEFPQFSKWIKVRKSNIDDNLQKAENYFLNKGFPKNAIQIIKQPRNKGIARDILAESRQGYDLLVTGKSDKNQIFEDMTGTVTGKLMSRTFHIPFVIVAGKPDPSGILIGYDGSGGAGKAIKAATELIRKDISKIQLCHVIRTLNLPLNKKSESQNDSFFFKTYFCELEEFLTRMNKQKVEPRLKKACEVFVNHGFDKDCVQWHLQSKARSRSRALLEIARGQRYGSLILGRRGHSAVKEFFMGRVGKKVVSMARDIAVWII